VIDDIGAEAITDWRRDVFFRIVDHRHDRMLPTIFTSNFTEDDLAREKRLGSRIAWRLHEMAWPNFVEMNGHNLRDVA
jgi:DNA replication protein DnaC